MTTEEAINVLKEIIDESWIFSDIEKAPTIDACEMAISALSDYDKMQKISLDLAFENDELMNKSKWIPTSERLPEEREWYLAVFKEKDTGFQLIPRVADYVGYGENKWQWIDGEGIPQEYLDLLECVAWQPLPEPYKAEKGGEEK